MATKLQVSILWTCMVVLASSAEVEEKTLESTRNDSTLSLLSRSEDLDLREDSNRNKEENRPRHQKNRFAGQGPFAPHSRPMGFQDGAGSQFHVGRDRNLKNGKFLDTSNNFHTHRDDDDDFQGGSFTNGGGFDPFKEMQQQQNQGFTGNTGTGNKIVNANFDHHGNIANFPEQNNIPIIPDQHSNNDHHPQMPIPRPINAQPALPHHGFMGGFGGHRLHQPIFPMQPHRLMPPTPMYRLPPPMYQGPMYSPYFRPTMQMAMRRQDAGSEEDSDEVGQQGSSNNNDGNNNNNNGNNNNNRNRQSIIEMLASVPREFVRQVTQQATREAAEDFTDFLDDLNPFR